MQVTLNFTMKIKKVEVSVLKILYPKILRNTKTIIFEVEKAYTINASESKRENIIG